MYKSYAGITFHFLHCRLKGREATRAGDVSLHQPHPPGWGLQGPAERRAEQSDSDQHQEVGHRPH